MIYRTFMFRCDKCFEMADYVSISEARKKGWAVSRNRYNCYCFNCAPSYRNVGCTGKPRLKYKIK